MGAAQLSIDEWIYEKKGGIYMHWSIIQFEKEGNSDTCHNMGKI